MRGYSLVEVLTIVAIISILGALAMIGGSAFLTSARLNEARDQYLAFIEEAKTRSATGHPHGIIIDSTSAYRLIRLTDAGFCSATTATACNCTSGCVSPCPTGEICLFGDFRRQGAESISTVYSAFLRADIQVSRNNACGDGEIWFDRKGVPRCSSWDTLAMSTISFTKGSVKKDITLDRAGRVRYEN